MRTRLTFFLGALALSSVAAACSSSYGSPTMPSAPAAGNATALSIVRGASGLTTAAFSPNPDTIAVGDTVTWTNNDTTTHTSTSDDGAWSSGNIAPGSTFSRTFSAPGTFTYHCAIHPGMVGTVSVR